MNLVVKNENTKFAESLTSGMGYPLWKKSFIYNNRKTNENLILIPLIKENDGRVSGILSETASAFQRYNL